LKNKNIDEFPYRSHDYRARTTMADETRTKLATILEAAAGGFLSSSVPALEPESVPVPVPVPAINNHETPFTR
jgi:hypothetical protein